MMDDKQNMDMGQSYRPNRALSAREKMIPPTGAPVDTTPMAAARCVVNQSSITQKATTVGIAAQDREVGRLARS